ncbi:hypothetical protein SASPL_109215 [Salvia splendens]|uniref:Uncharacterized protein n=1 Tax=Salvia splendens TaxID=180675 RepID=A0A8X8YFX2_SALSN|nr:hypothetical protein SASPL_109215 [Salvia splendens]
MEEFYGAEAPQKVDVQPPEVVSMKGYGSRLPSRVEKALKLKSRPMRQCKKCQEWGHHNSRNCDKFKEKEKMSRLPSRVEKALKLKSKPMRQCKKCQEWGHHNSRNCDKFKEKEKMRSSRNSDV